MKKTTRERRQHLPHQSSPSIEEGLLSRIFSDPYEHAYDSHGGAVNRRRTRLGSLAVLVATCLLCTLSVWSARTLNSTQQTSRVDAATEGLRKQLEERRKENILLADRNTKLNERIDKLSKREFPEVNVSPNTQIIAGVIPVEGPGVQIVLTDSTSSNRKENEESRVQDKDLQLLVNTLWAAGAEAISINGIRLGTRTAVRSAAGSILVNLKAVSSPYTVSAIGPRKELLNSISGGPMAAYLADLNSTYGIGSSTTILEEIKMPAVSFRPLESVDKKK
ncbi:DUF881 domain-containing protein [Actinomycetaceae bacterium TAE3-ERU4]|nr:DUF881 domain-containing protein [Actinomycetaceae bacterium TAE3-ERU4]